MRGHCPWVGKTVENVYAHTSFMPNRDFGLGIQGLWRSWLTLETWFVSKLGKSSWCQIQPTSLWSSTQKMCPQVPHCCKYTSRIQTMISWWSQTCSYSGFGNALHWHSISCARWQSRLVGGEHHHWVQDGDLSHAVVLVAIDVNYIQLSAPTYLVALVPLLTDVNLIQLGAPTYLLAPTAPTQTCIIDQCEESDM